MFDYQNGDFDIQKKHINDEGEYVITAGTSNNGILGQSNVEAKIINKNTITIDMFGNSFYRQFRYKMVTHARVFALLPKFAMSEKQGLYIVNSLKFLTSKFGYENMCSWNKIKEEKIKLPTKDGKIDFIFMKTLISELEEERISELSAYLKVSRLDNYELSDEERKVLEDFNNIKWKEYKIKELFEVSSSKKRFDANKVDLVEQRGFPYVVRTSKNNGIKGFINEEEKFLNPGNTISFGQDTATMWYQENQYFTGDKIKILRSNFKEFKKENSHFFITSMLKPFKVFSWGASSFSEKIIKEQEFLLPVNSKDEIDFEYMRIFIQAIKKLVIKDVVIYADEKIKATKKVVRKD